MANSVQHNPHLKLVLSIVDVERIKSKIVSSGSRFKCWVRLLACRPRCSTILDCQFLDYMSGNVLGVFAHPPEPTAENLVERFAKRR